MKESQKFKGRFEFLTSGGHVKNETVVNQKVEPKKK